MAQRLAGPGERAAAGLGEGDAVAVADEQGRAQLALQARDGAADGGWDMPTSSAAAVNPPCSATAISTLSCANVIPTYPNWYLTGQLAEHHRYAMSTRMTIEVDGRRASYLTAGERGPVVLLLHGTYWSRVWEPVLDRLAAAGLRPVAVDLPGLGRSEGELTAETATVPALAAWVGRFAAAIGEAGPLAVAATTSAAGSPSTCWPAGWRRCAGWRW